MDECKMITFEYGAMSSKYSLEAPHKLTAYCAIVAHYDRSAHMVIVYSPEECKSDNWASFDGKISENLNILFGGSKENEVDQFDKYFEEHVEEVKAAMKTIKQLV